LRVTLAHPRRTRNQSLQVSPRGGGAASASPRSTSWTSSASVGRRVTDRPARRHHPGAPGPWSRV